MPHRGRRRPLPGVRSNPATPSDPIPTCDVTIEGQRITLRPHAVTDTIADLARALDSEPDAGLWIDGRLVAANRLLTESGLHVGSEVAIAGGPDPREQWSGPPIEVAVIAGPSCEGWRPLPAGRHCVGRSPAAHLRLDDPDGRAPPRGHRRGRGWLDHLHAADRPHPRPPRRCVRRCLVRRGRRPVAPDRSQPPDVPSPAVGCTDGARRREHRRRRPRPVASCRAARAEPAVGSRHDRHLRARAASASTGLRRSSVSSGPRSPWPAPD